ncbi:hypothetical protein MGLY_10820 [Neomoorella glycerini]|uniref:Uncharacterized protein n=1 Tax=Neomoorella glycerini TaxID=55779 RepID=A0A6I5ZPB1_9FIRM|nr:hypothetical protein [Moorella glycerini]QGP91740.1 hypothetical protein MGLY_10820 [Moorella glycerini]
MSQQELLKRVISVLESAGIQYMLTGSLASSLQGEPRLTHDIDIVVAVPENALKKLSAAFPPPDYYLDEQSILAAIAEKSMFNLIDLTTGDKVDFWILTDQPFDQSRFSRRVTNCFMGQKIVVSRPEDTILAKLRWAKLAGGSEKQLTDALRVYEVQFGNLNMEYLESWARELGVENLLAEIKFRSKCI